MMTFLTSNNFSREAVEGIMEMLFGDLSPEGAGRLDSLYSELSEEDKMSVILKHIIQAHYEIEF